MAMDQESEQKKKTSQDSQPDLDIDQERSRTRTRRVAPGNTRSIKGGGSRWEKGGEFGEKRHTDFPLAEAQEGQDEIVNQGQQEQSEQPFKEEKTMAMDQERKKDRVSSQARQQELNSAQKNVGAA